MGFAFESTSFRWVSSAAAPLEQVLREQFSGASWGAVRKLVSTGKVRVAGNVVTEPRRLVEPEATIEIQMTAPRRRPGRHESDGRVLYCDPHLVVVNKPVGLASVDHEREATSLQAEIRAWLSAKEKRPVPPLKVVHRLDKVTSGVMLFARTLGVQRDLKDQFRAHTTGRHYMAVAHGTVVDATLNFRLVRDRGDGIRGVTSDPTLGHHSVTQITVKERLARCSVIECRLETGRTHQIRIHLAHSGHPLVGDPLYTRGFEGPLILCSRTLLHAASLSFSHPVFRTRQRYEVALPEDFDTFIGGERARGR